MANIELFSMKKASGIVVKGNVGVNKNEIYQTIVELIGEHCGEKEMAIVIDSSEMFPKQYKVYEAPEKGLAKKLTKPAAEGVEQKVDISLHGYLKLQFVEPDIRTVTDKDPDIDYPIASWTKSHEVLLLYFNPLKKGIANKERDAFLAYVKENLK